MIWWVKDNSSNPIYFCLHGSLGLILDLGKITQTEQNYGTIMHLSSMVCPPSQAIVGNEGEIFFVLLQNRAPVVGHLPTPVFYKQSTCIWDIYLMIFSFSAKSSSVCTVCVNNGYIHFTCRQSNPLYQPETWTGDLQSKFAPGVGKWTFTNPLVCPTFAWEGSGAYNW